MARIEAVVFDIGNVLLHWDPDGFYDRVIGAERRARLFAEVDLAAMNARVDMGEDFGALVEETALANPSWAAEVRLWRDRWIEMAQPEISGSVAILTALKARGVPVFALSNFGVDSFAVALRHYPWLDAFDRRYLSGQLGVMKPDPEIYRIVEADCGVAPGALLFADDKRANVEAAVARGWQGHLFEGPEGLARRLMAAGLLSAEEART
jgi:2-haloacid dehalogenase